MGCYAILALASFYFFTTGKQDTNIPKCFPFPDVAPPCFQAETQPHYPSPSPCN